MTEPIPPCNIAIMYQYGLILTVVAQAFEEYTTREKGELKRLDINVDTIAVPGICSDPV